jgi:hypothetical protein
MNPHDGLVLGEKLGDQFSYHVLNTSGQPMIHVTRNRRPEIVLFGADQHFAGPLILNAGNQIMVTSRDGKEVAVSKHTMEEDQRRIVSMQVDDVVRAIVELGGTYPDVVQALQEAKSAGALSSRLEVDALPTAGRRYQRIAHHDADEQEPGRSVASSHNPLPELFSQKDASPASEKGPAADATAAADEKGDGKPHRVKDFFAKMVGRESSGAPSP